MTQNTQTTAERIEKQLNDIHDTFPGSVYDCFRVIANEVAAEIDGLAAQLRTALAERDEAWAKAADWEHEEGLAEIADTQTNLHYAEVAKNRELTAQLAEARAEVTQIINANDDERRADAEVIAGLKAEIERLRLPAEAWEAYRALWAAPFADPDKRDAAETRYQVAIAADSAARARAAKVTP